MMRPKPKLDRQWLAQLQETNPRAARLWERFGPGPWTSEEWAAVYGHEIAPMEQSPRPKPPPAVVEAEQAADEARIAYEAAWGEYFDLRRQLETIKKQLDSDSSRFTIHGSVIAADPKLRVQLAQLQDQLQETERKVTAADLALQQSKVRESKANREWEFALRTNGKIGSH